MGGQSTIKLTVEEVRDKRRNKGYLGEGYFSAMLLTFNSIKEGATITQFYTCWHK